MLFPTKTSFHYLTVSLTTLEISSGSLLCHENEMTANAGTFKDFDNFRIDNKLHPLTPKSNYLFRPFVLLPHAYCQLYEMYNSVLSPSQVGN